MKFVGANISSGIINSRCYCPTNCSFTFSLLKYTHYISYFLLFGVYRAQKRAAWRQARLKSLEQDALQAQIMIQSLNTDGDDLTEPVKRRAKDTLDGVEEEEVSRAEYLLSRCYYP